MLAHLPSSFQLMLNQYSQQFEWLNDIVKGREVFSNIGKVARNSSLLRFLTAKDDNDRKTLVWGILTDNNGVMRITLRDFRPHVTPLLENGHGEIANQIAQDYLDSYASGLNVFVAELHRITLSSRETKLSKSERTKL